MGCCYSGKRKSGSSTETKDPPRAQYSWEKKERVDRSLLIISDQEGGTVGRLPGQLNGKQFRIKNCQSSTVLVLDYTDTVTVENCVDCQIFVGPTKGSLYLRECTNCRLVVACEQFRARDCKKCSISLFSSTQPVIESSTKLKFACFQFGYPQLNDQFKAIGQSVFNNCWSNVHDFDRGIGDSNWALLPAGTPPTFALPTEGEFSELGLSLAAEASVVPLTVGSGREPGVEVCLVAFFEKSDYEAKALEFARKLYNKASLISTKKMLLESHQVERLFSHDEAIQSIASKGCTVFLEVCGEGCVRLCHSLLSQEVKVALATGMVPLYLSPSAQQGAIDAQTLKSVLEVSLTMQ